MRYLGLALYAEGPTDYHFLRPLLLRLCGDICLRESHQQVELNDDVLALNHPERFQNEVREERVLEAAKEARGAWSILFVHADADGDLARARAERVQPAINKLCQEFGQSSQGVAVIPIRETEAWALWDGDALRQVFGTTLNNQALGVPSTAAAAERVSDPKKSLEAAFSNAHPRNRRRRTLSVSEMLNAIGEQVSLERLRQLPAFKALELDLKQAMRALQILA